MRNSALGICAASCVTPGLGVAATLVRPRGRQRTLVLSPQAWQSDLIAAGGERVLCFVKTGSRAIQTGSTPVFEGEKH
ncbi:hypothetical protein [Brucella sp. NBRC 12953]|uniref:hypothetical protein n=1 Tax=Brucella sp. NBRC 12953 TaxID=3075481 RepID=UPI00333FC354